MTLLEALKQLAEKFPEKWRYWESSDWKTLEKVVRIPEGEETEVIIQTTDMEYLSTEDCDAILAEHGLVMWVSCHFGAWHGRFGTWDNPHGIVPYPTKRAATEATFLAALEYILKDKP